jgi:hypothetical protein
MILRSIPFLCTERRYWQIERSIICTCTQDFGITVRTRQHAEL